MKPDCVYKDGSVEVAMFETNQQGIPERRYRIQRRYLDVDGNWQTSSEFKFKDLPRLQGILAAISPRGGGA